MGDERSIYYKVYGILSENSYKIFVDIKFYTYRYNLIIRLAKS